MNTGICSRSGRQPDHRVDVVLLVELEHLLVELLAIVLVLACSFFISGCSRCMAIIDRVPLRVSGVSTIMIDERQQR